LGVPHRCNWELEEVGRFSKPCVPVVIETVMPARLPEALSKIHLLPAEGVFAEDAHLSLLVETLNADHAWTRDGIRLADRARQWIAKDRPSALLLRGAAIGDAEHWSASAPKSGPPPAADILDYIHASRSGATRRQRRWTAGATVVAVVASAIAWYALWQRNKAIYQQGIAITNETASLAELPALALSNGRPDDAVKLALAAWPRNGDATRPQMRKTLGALSGALDGFLEQKRLTVSSGRVNFAALSADGARVVVALGDTTDISPGREHTAGVLDAATGNVVAELKAHSHAVLFAAFSPDGKRIVTAGQDHKAILWDAVTGEALWEMQHPSAFVNSASFTQDGKAVLTATGDGVARLWDIASKRQLQKGFQRRPFARVSADERRREACHWRVRRRHGAYLGHPG
jgi:hypothetical protein